MHQFAGTFTLVAAYGAAGGAVEVGQAGEAVTGQHAVHGGGRQPQQVRDAGRSPPVQGADFNDPALGTGWGAVRAGGGVGHARLAERAVAIRPPLGRGGRDLEAFGSSPQRLAVLDDAAGQAQASGLGQRCIMVGNKGLSVGVDVAIHTEAEGPRLFQDPSVETGLTRPQPPGTEHLARARISGDRQLAEAACQIVSIVHR
jgi:hypothetical protein